ncbi:hypothetical protein PR048_006322 [Dryococelus australis]|uniref:Uncharacterized protein n=1 Tax=Dryococelus australis TaxID=614101 RepID=A0ABQ9IBA7_9NEOP|nr:hypothetical protein PR048_006322 [Dryococelus australis]
MKHRTSSSIYSEIYAYFHDAIHYEQIAKSVSYLISISHFGTNIDELDIQNHEISLVQHFYIGTRIKLNPSSELGSFDLGSGKMLVQPGISELVSIPGRVTGFSQVGIVPNDAVGQRVFSGISRFPAPTLRRRSIFTSLTLLGSQDLASADVKVESLVYQRTFLCLLGVQTVVLPVLLHQVAQDGAAATNTSTCKTTTTLPPSDAATTLPPSNTATTPRLQSCPLPNGTEDCATAFDSNDAANRDSATQIKPLHSSFIVAQRSWTGWGRANYWTFANSVREIRHTSSREYGAAPEWGVEEAGDPREDPPTNSIVRHDCHMRKFGVTRPGIALVGGERAGRSATAVPKGVFIIVATCFPSNFVSRSFTRIYRVANESVNFANSDILQMTHSAIDSISPADWKKQCDHVRNKKLENDYLVNGGLMEEEISQVLKNLQSSTSSSSESGNDSNLTSDVTKAKQTYDGNISLEWRNRCYVSSNVGQ